MVHTYYFSASNTTQKKIVKAVADNPDKKFYIIISRPPALPQDSESCER